MTWFECVLVANLALETVAVITKVGKPRDVITPGVAAINTIVTGFYIIGILLGWCK